MPVLSLDTLMMALHHSVPSLEIDIRAEPPVIGETMWPIIRAFAECVLGSETDHLIDGDMLQTSQVASLHAAGGDQVRSCFMGYQHIDPQQKFADIRQHAGLPNDWLSDSSDEHVLEVAEFGIRYSQSQKVQCDQLGLKHIDCSTDFERSIEEAAAHLVGSIH
ncbi:hypothetical protein [Adhaeretor mobilis]|nr:hypothetical protein [Adhaeretor mobilis]